MTIIDILTKAAGIPASKLRELILAGAGAVPDLADEAAAIIAAFDEALSTEKLIALAAVIVNEAKDIATGKLDPHDHPSDAA